MSRLNWRWWLSPILLFAVLWAGVGCLRPSLTEKLERQALDWHLSRLEIREVEPEIVLVTAGEETLSEFGKWPWPRRYHAKLLGRLGHARAILLDILFPETSTPEDDLALVEVIKSLGNVVAALHLSPGNAGEPARIIAPFPGLLQSCAAAGLTNIEPDLDGLVRFASPARQVGEMLVPSISLAAIPLINDVEIRFHQEKSGNVSLVLGAHELPIDSKGRMWVRFSEKPPEQYEYLDVLSGEISPEVFRGKVVVVGVAASGAEDFYIIPAGLETRVITGAQFNGEALRSLLSGKAPKRVSPLTDAGIVLVLSLIGCLAGLRGRPLFSFVKMMVVVLCFAFVNHWLFTNTLQWSALLVPCIGIIATFFSTLIIRFRLVHIDWRMKAFSISTIYNLSRAADATFKSYGEYMESIWPDVEKASGVRLISSHVSYQDATEHGQLDSESDTESGQDRIILLQNRREQPRYKIFVPVPAESPEDRVGYTILGTKRKPSAEVVQTMASLVISSSWFFRLLSESCERKKLLLDTIQAIFSAVDIKDPITGGHSNRVSRLTMEILDHLNLDPKTVEDIHLGALIHDIGKIGIPDDILRKREGLTEGETAIMREHTAMGAKILRSVKLPENTVRALQEHHESLDGAGYPAGLKGERISLAGRVVAVADVFDALINDRPYRDGMALEQVCDFLYEKGGTKFDADVVKAVLELKAPPGWVPSGVQRCDDSADHRIRFKNPCLKRLEEYPLDGTREDSKNNPSQGDCHEESML